MEEELRWWKEGVEILYCPVGDVVRYGIDAVASRVLWRDVGSAVRSHVTVRLFDECTKGLALLARLHSQGADRQARLVQRDSQRRLAGVHWMSGVCGSSGRAGPAEKTPL